MGPGFRRGDSWWLRSLPWLVSGMCFDSHVDRKGVDFRHDVGLVAWPCRTHRLSPRRRPGPILNWCETFADGHPRGSRVASRPPHHEGSPNTGSSPDLILRCEAQRSLEGRGRPSPHPVNFLSPHPKPLLSSPHHSRADGLQRTFAGGAGWVLGRFSACLLVGPPCDERSIGATTAGETQRPEAATSLLLSSTETHAPRDTSKRETVDRAVIRPFGMPCAMRNDL